MSAAGSELDVYEPRPMRPFRRYLHSGRTRQAGPGLGKRMLTSLLTRPGCEDVRRLETTITRSNAASWGLFRGFARDMGGDIADAPHFERDAHLGGLHATEHLVTIALPRQHLRAAA